MITLWNWECSKNQKTYLLFFYRTFCLFDFYYYLMWMNEVGWIPAFKNHLILHLTVNQPKPVSPTFFSLNSQTKPVSVIFFSKPPNQTSFSHLVLLNNKTKLVSAILFYQITKPNYFQSSCFIKQPNQNRFSHLVLSNYQTKPVSAILFY